MSVFFHKDWLKLVATHIYILIYLWNSSHSELFTSGNDSILQTQPCSQTCGKAYQWLARMLVWPFKFPCTMKISWACSSHVIGTGCWDVLMCFRSLAVAMMESGPSPLSSWTLHFADGWYGAGGCDVGSLGSCQVTFQHGIFSGSLSMGRQSTTLILRCASSQSGTHARWRALW